MFRLTTGTERALRWYELLLLILLSYNILLLILLYYRTAAARRAGPPKARRPHKRKLLNLRGILLRQQCQVARRSEGHAECDNTIKTDRNNGRYVALAPRAHELLCTVVAVEQVLHLIVESVLLLYCCIRVFGSEKGHEQKRPQFSAQRQYQYNFSSRSTNSQAGIAMSSTVTSRQP